MCWFLVVWGPHCSGGSHGGGARRAAGSSGHCGWDLPRVDDDLDDNAGGRARTRVSGKEHNGACFPAQRTSAYVGEQHAEGLNSSSTAGTRRQSTVRPWSTEASSSLTDFRSTIGKGELA